MVPRLPTPPRRSHAPSTKGFFDKYPPRLPLVALTPQMARPQAQARLASRRLRIQYYNQTKGLVIVVLRFPTRARKERRTATATTSSAGPSWHARKGSASSTQSGTPSNVACGCTLDGELHISDGVTEGELPEFDIEPHDRWPGQWAHAQRLPCARWRWRRPSFHVCRDGVV